MFETSSNDSNSTCLVKNYNLDFLRQKVNVDQIKNPRMIGSSEGTIFKQKDGTLMSETSSIYSNSTCPQKNYTSKFLPEDNHTKVCFDRRLANKLGVNSAIILGRLIWSIEGHMEKGDVEFFKDGQWWMYDTTPALAEYSGLSEKQVKRVLKSLRDLKIIESQQFDRKFSQRRNWFSINVDALYVAAEISCPIGTKGTDQSVQKVPIDKYKRDRSIGTKGTNTSLYTKNPPENSKTKNHSFPPTPQGGETGNGIGNFLNNLISIERGKGEAQPIETTPSQNRKIIPPARPQVKQGESYLKGLKPPGIGIPKEPATPEEIAKWDLLFGEPW